jgi:hypothetical protein
MRLMLCPGGATTCFNPPMSNSNMSFPLMSNRTELLKILQWVLLNGITIMVLIGYWNQIYCDLQVLNYTFIPNVG